MSGLEIIPVATASSSIDGSLSAYNDVESNEVKVEMGYVGDNRYTNHNQEVDNDNMKLVHRWKRIFIGMVRVNRDWLVFMSARKYLTYSAVYFSSFSL